MIISVFPRLAVYSFQGYRHYELGKSCYIHKPDPEHFICREYPEHAPFRQKVHTLEAKVLDLALVLHMEHGGRKQLYVYNTCCHIIRLRYICHSRRSTLLTKGPLNGGGDLKVMEMMKNIHCNVEDVTDEEQIREYIRKIVRGEAFDKSGVVYGMGQPVYLCQIQELSLS